MKAILVAAGLALVLAGATALHAQDKVYTWTDVRGRIHITDEPPPSEASIKDIVEAPQLTSAETRERELDRQRRMERREADQQRSEVQEALRRAREADEQAQEAIRRADEQTQQAIDYRKRFGNTPSRRQQFKYKILAEEEKAEAARADAQKAIDRARDASEKARTVAGPQTQESKP